MEYVRSFGLFSSKFQYVNLQKKIADVVKPRFEENCIKDLKMYQLERLDAISSKQRAVESSC